jgi:DNA-binding NtrC family response regulator
VPFLTVLTLTESFSAMWPTLAESSGLTLRLASGAAELHQLRDAVGLVAAGGAEERLEMTLREIAPEGGEVIAVGALANHHLAAAVVRAGGAELFAMPDDAELLRSWMRERGDRLHAAKARQAFVSHEAAKYRFEGILGDSDALRQALERAALVIPHGTVTVLISGETGTGKELLARAIHYNGPRRDAPFVDVNCAAIPDTLLESELFGHEKGAFTDATTTKPGLFEVANGGTLFLDEIGHLPLALQGKMLRALEERAIRRVGGTRTIPVDVRIVAASHVDLASAVRRREFREDLYYRLNVVPLSLPPLRERRDDILPLARHFLARFAREYGLTVPRLTSAAERALAAHDWSGNVRELRNAMERAVLLHRGASLDAGDVSLGSMVAVPTGALPFPATLGEITRAAAAAMVERCGGNKSEAARRLDISRPRLLRLLDGSGDDFHDNEG